MLEYVVTAVFCRMLGLPGIPCLGQGMEGGINVSFTFEAGQVGEFHGGKMGVVSIHW